MDIQGIILTIQGMVEAIVPLLITIALVVFIWGIIQYITAGADEEKRSAARSVILYGVIGLFAIVSVWGLVAIIQNTFGVTDTSTIVPQYNF